MNVHTDNTTGTPIFRALRESICTLEKPFGTVLREVELAEEFGVSRTPIRQALHQLAAIGLVETRNGVGTIVTAGDPETLEDIYRLRIQLTALIGQFATRECPATAAENMRALHAEVLELEPKLSPKDLICGSRRDPIHFEAEDHPAFGHAIAAWVGPLLKAGQS